MAKKSKHIEHIIYHRASYSKAWLKLTVNKRLLLLKSLGLDGEEFLGTVELSDVAKEDDFSKLPIPVRVSLGPAYSGGTFSIENMERNYAALRRVARSVGFVKV